MSSEISSIPHTGDIELKMRRSLGLDAPPTPGTIPSSPSDPLKAARQAIRSQSAAREYVERQLAHAEATIQDLRTKLHHARQEKDTAVQAARSATAMRLSVQRALIATEAALATEKAARDHGDRAFREAKATISHLQTKLDAAAQGLETVRAELVAERQTRQKAEDALREATVASQIVASASGNEAVSPVIQQPERVLPAPSPSDVDRPAKAGRATTVDPIVRRPVGRPRKAGSVQVTTNKVKGTGATKPKGIASGRNASDQQPVQWWIEGWDALKA